MNSYLETRRNKSAENGEKKMDRKDFASRLQEFATVGRLLDLLTPKEVSNEVNFNANLKKLERKRDSLFLQLGEEPCKGTLHAISQVVDFEIAALKKGMHEKRSSFVRCSLHNISQESAKDNRVRVYEKIAKIIKQQMTLISKEIARLKELLKTTDDQQERLKIISRLEELENKIRSRRPTRDNNRSEGSELK